MAPPFPPVPPPGVAPRVVVPLVVAIDGPAGSGKSTLARALASELTRAFRTPWSYLDTGAMYRAVTWAALRRGIDLQDVEAIASLSAGERIHLSRDGRIRLDGEDVTAGIRSAEVNAAVSTVAANPRVRAVMVVHQRAFALENGRIVAEGRDMGTVVFPEAAVKIYLDASPEERARRRIEEIHGTLRGTGGATGDAESPERIRESIERRDRHDRERAVAPLCVAEGAVVIHTTDRAPEQVLAEALRAVQSRVPPPAGG